MRERTKMAGHRTWRDLRTKQGFVPSLLLGGASGVVAWFLLTPRTRMGLTRLLASIGVGFVALVVYFFLVFVYHLIRGAPRLFMRLVEHAISAQPGWTASVDQFGLDVGLSVANPSLGKHFPPIECEVRDKRGDVYRKTQPVSAVVGWGNPIRTDYQFAYPQEFPLAPLDDGEFQLAWYVLPARSRLAEGRFTVRLERVPDTGELPHE